MNSDCTLFQNECMVDVCVNENMVTCFKILQKKRCTFVNILRGHFSIAAKHYANNLLRSNVMKHLN